MLKKNQYIIFKCDFVFIKFYLMPQRGYNELKTKDSVYSK